jgi:hypothetical protein
MRQVYPWRWQDPDQQTKPHNTQEIMMSSHLNVLAAVFILISVHDMEWEHDWRYFMKYDIAEQPPPKKCQYFPIYLQIKRF